jgi:hypothetical protein
MMRTEHGTDPRYRVERDSRVQFVNAIKWGVIEVILFIAVVLIVLYEVGVF